MMYCFAFICIILAVCIQQQPEAFTLSTQLLSSHTSASRSRNAVVLHSSESPDDTPSGISKAPSLNGKMIMPTRVLAGGLRGHKIPAVYAILDSNYKRGSGEGWEHVQHVSITKNLAADISYFSEQHGSSSVAQVRAMSFSYPQKAVMTDFSNGWKAKVADAGGAGFDVGWGRVPKDFDMDEQPHTPRTVEESIALDAPAADIALDAPAAEGSTVVTVGDEYEFDDIDEDMDEDELDDYLQMMAESRAAVSTSQPSLFVDNTGLTSIDSVAPPQYIDANEDGGEEVVSPFEQASSVESNTVTSLTSDDDALLDLTSSNVDEVLDEVRPYLISDGGNVSVQRVDEETGNVYLLLEGACGSCPSSTVTMKMGIERVLTEKFGSKLGEVLQVDPDDGDADGATELTLAAVQSEVRRMSNAMVAMGAVVRVIGVDPIGTVEIEFRGPNKVQKGLEMALLDVEYCKHVKFVS